MARDIVVTSQGGDAYSITFGPHTVVVDQPVPAGGTDTGPTPTELFVAGLAGCVGYYAGKYLREHDLDPSVVVRTRYKWALAPNRVARVELAVEAPGLTDAHRAAFHEAIDHCSVHNSLRQPPSVEVTVAA